MGAGSCEAQPAESGLASTKDAKPLGLLSSKAFGTAGVVVVAGPLDELHGSFPQRTEDSEGAG